MQLRVGALLQDGKYRIEGLLGQGGFGITYLAVQTGLNRKVAIKEFFMKEHCNRESDTSHVTVPSVGSKDLVLKFRQKFVKEAQTIAELDNPNVVSIFDIFEENETAYYVMKYVEGGSLSDIVSEDNPLPEDLAVKYIRQIGNALDYLHKRRLLHLDVKPSNAMLQDGVVVLIDFGISKHYDAKGGQTSATPAGISKGYAPIEQYNQGVQSFSPATDVYSLAATLYNLVTGKLPPDAADVYEDGLPEFPIGLSAKVCNAITIGMCPRRKDRPQSVEEFLALLGPEEEPVIQTVSKTSRKSKITIWALVVLLMAVLAGIGVQKYIKHSRIAEMAEKRAAEYNVLMDEGDSLKALLSTNPQSIMHIIDQAEDRYHDARLIEQHWGSTKHAGKFTRNAAEAEQYIRSVKDSLITARKAEIEAARGRR